MKILAIETSCDETAIALLEIDRKKNVDHFKILSNQISSQTIHSQYGGVFPMMAKREHSKNILDIFKKTLEEAGLLKEKEVKKPLSKKTEIKIK